MTSNSRTQNLYEHVYYARNTTKEYRTHELFPYTFYLFHYFYIAVFFTSKHCNILVKCSNILHLLILMSLIIPFSE